MTNPPPADRSGVAVDNVIVTAGYSMLLPGRGFKDILSANRVSTGFVLFTFVY